MSDRIDIHDEVQALCDKLGFNYPFVKRLAITPQLIEVDVYRANDAGEKFLEHGKVALETHTIKVAT